MFILKSNKFQVLHMDHQAGGPQVENRCSVASYLIIFYHSYSVQPSQTSASILMANIPTVVTNYNWNSIYMQNRVFSVVGPRSGMDYLWHCACSLSRVHSDFILHRKVYLVKCLSFNAKFVGLKFSQSYPYYSAAFVIVFDYKKVASLIIIFCYCNCQFNFKTLRNTQFRNV